MPDVADVGAQVEDGVVELARHGQRPPLRAAVEDGVELRGFVRGGAATVMVIVRASASMATSTCS